MTTFEQATAPLKKFADFKGRASRSEFWTFLIFVLIAQAAARLVDAMLFRTGMMPGPIAGLTGLLLFNPQVAVTVRRLHDVNKSGKELVVPLVMRFATPLVAFAAMSGFIGRIIILGYAGLVLLVFAGLLTSLIKKGSNIPNKYGAAPTAFTFGKI
jgi:uncharacterized membrane protein YhaH (DUF805 family)